MENEFITKYSYSKLSTYKDCPYKFKLIYIDVKFINTPSIDTSFGTLVHYTEECIANDLKNGLKIDYDKYINQFIEINDEKEGLFGVKKLKEMFPDDFYKEDKSGMKYSDKCALYVNESIYRLESYLKANPNLEIVGIEQSFNVIYKNYAFHGFIDRVFKDKVTNKIIIEDIKTYSKEVEKKNLTTPLQFVFYTLAAEELYNVSENDISCAYDLPVCLLKQEAGTKGYLTRGLKKIDELLNLIETNQFKPNPTPLCHWCTFCPTYDNQPEEAKGYCPYYSKWTPDNKTFEVEYMWMGQEEHDAILQAFREKDFNKDNLMSNNLNKLLNDNLIIVNSDNKRFFKIKL